MTQADWITYFWSGPEDKLEAALYRSFTDEDGQPTLAPINPTLGIAQGTSDYGDVGTYYTCVRAQGVLETPSGLRLTDPYIVTHLLGVWL